MEINLDNDEFVNISGYNGDIWLTNKLDGQWMYGTLPEKILPNIENGIAKFFIPLRERKYGNIWQVQGVQNLSQLSTGNNIEIIKKDPLQFKVTKDHPIQDIVITRADDQYIQLNRPLLEDESIIAKRRVNSNYGDAYFSKSFTCLLGNNQSSVELNITKIINNLGIVEGDIIDFFVKNSMHEKKIPVVKIPGEWYLDGNSHSKYRIYQTAANTLAIYFYSEKSIYINEIVWSKSNLIIRLDENTLAQDITNLEITEATRKSSDSSIRSFIPVTSYINDNQIVIDDNFLKSELNRRDKFGFRLTFSYKNSVIKNQFRTNHSEILIADKEYELSNIGGKNFLSLELIRKKRNDTIKIAVLGSSHTRPMFRSDSYFNPYYKNIYEVVYTQFHSSIISLIGNGRKYEDKYYKTRNNTVRHYIKTDFEKSFFEELSKSNPDYLLIDVYIDVQMGVIYFGDGTVISYNSYQAESNYVLDNKDNETTLSTVFNDDNYMEKFSEALKIFKGQILNIIPENRIIIHSFDMSVDYKDSDNRIKKYSQKMGSIVELNEIAVEMQLLLERTFSNASVLDVRDAPFHGGVDNPIGNMPHHFESDYYSLLLDELNKIVLRIEGDNRS